MELDGPKNVLPSYNTEVENLPMAGRMVRKAWSVKDGEKKTRCSEIVPYEKSGVSICTIATTYDDATELNSVDAKSVWFEAEPFTKTGIGETRGNGGQTNTLQTLTVAITDSANAADNTSASLTSKTQQTASTTSVAPLQVGTISTIALDQEADDNNPSSLDTVTQPGASPSSALQVPNTNTDEIELDHQEADEDGYMPPFDTNLSTLHTFGLNQAFSRALHEYLPRRCNSSSHQPHSRSRYHAA